jgi:hypothetical protein
VTRTVPVSRDLLAIVALILLSLPGCVERNFPADPRARVWLSFSSPFPEFEDAGSRPRPASSGAGARSAIFGTVRDAVGIERPVATSEIVPAARTSVFGILTLDAAGNPQFVATTEVPNVAKQAYGWFIWVGDSPRPVRSTETFALARPPVRRSTVEPEPSIFSSGNEDIVITKDQTGVRTETPFTSPDGRTAMNRIESTPLDGFIWNSWEVEPGDPLGRYQVSVSLPGGREETFSFSLGEPELSDQSFEFCPYMDVYVDWGRAKEARDADLTEGDVSAQALTVFAETLMRDHPFALVDDPEDAYWVASVTVSKNVMNPETTHRYVKVRTLAHSQGKAVRPTYFGDANDYGFLFEVPLAEHGTYVRGLAQRFADKLFPHAYRLCAGWTSRPVEGAARLERIREGLTEEMERVRRERVERERRKLLELEAVEPPTP